MQLNSDNEWQSAARGAQFRADIQGLRGVAVLLVLFFHVFPWTVTGGYVGVDVFFVISGFLITGLLVSELRENSTISIGTFYARRIRRLLPAATLVLVAIVVFSGLLPAVRLRETSQGVIASALYVENWRLLFQATDYLAAENAPSPTQHFWSLSIEEQFYIAWPALMLAVAFVARRARRSADSGVAWLLAMVALASYAYSIFETSSSRNTAYFDSFARIWELGLGGLLAIVIHRLRIPAFAKNVAGILGATLIFAAAFNFDTATAFPGPWAMMPVGGTMLIILGGSHCGERMPVVARLLSLRPLQFVGDISYSLYLWHWPLLIYFTAVAGRLPSVLEGCGIVLASVLVAYMSKRFVEDPLRHGARRGRGFGPAVVMGVFCAALSCSAALFARPSVQAPAAASVAADAMSRYPGAMTLLKGVKPQAGVSYIPSAAEAPFDRADAYARNCIAKYGDDTVKECEYPTPNAKGTIVLVGDSHAVQWIPVLAEVASRRGYNLIAMTKVSCPFARVVVNTKDGKPFDECTRWGLALEKRVRELKPDVIVTTESRRYDPRGAKVLSPQAHEMMVHGILDRWAVFLGTNAKVFAIADTPRMASVVPDCMSRPGVDVAICSTPRTRALVAADALLTAAQKEPRVRVVDLNDAICGKTVCEPVVGNILVWMDSNHLTATYARTLVSEFDRQFAIQ